MKKLLVFLMVLFMAGPAFGAVVSSRTMPEGGAAMWDVSTFGGATRDYNGASGVSDWEIATRGDITGAGTKSPVLECYDDNSGAPYEITVNNIFQNASAHTSATKFRVIKAAEGHENRFRKNAGVILHGSAAVTSIVKVTNEKYLKIYDIGFTMVALNDATNRKIVSLLTSPNTTVVGCYVFDVINSNVGSGSTFGFYTAAADCAIINSAVNGVDAYLGSGFVSNMNNTNLTYYNCTSINNSDYGYANGDKSITAVNCISENNGANWQAWAVINKTTCTDGGGVVFAADGISLDPTDTVAIDQGTDLEGDHSFNDDGMGIERGDSAYTGAAWDIGALEYATGEYVLLPAGGGITRKLLLNLF